MLGRLHEVLGTVSRILGRRNLHRGRVLVEVDLWQVHLNDTVNNEVVLVDEARVGRLNFTIVAHDCKHLEPLVEFLGLMNHVHPVVDEV